MCLTMLCFSASSQAAMVWAVATGDDPEVNDRQVLLLAGLAANPQSPNVTVDIYLDSDEASIYGWDFSFMSNGAASIEGVVGSLLGPGAPLVNGGFRQFGSDDLALTPLLGESIFLMSLDLALISPGEIVLDESSSFVDAGFSTVFFDSTALVEIAEVPAPATIYLFCSALLALTSSRGLGSKQQ